MLVGGKDDGSMVRVTPRSSSLRLARGSLRTDICGKVFRLPPHRRADSRRGARMIVEKEFIDRPGFQFAVLGKFERNLREAIGLTGGIQSEQVGLHLLHTDYRVH